jgi:adenine-specific DNA-methyltransferase
VPQRPSDWPKRKIVFPDIAEPPPFLLDSSNAIVNGDCYWMPLGDQVPLELALLLLAVGNSSLATCWYDAVCGNRLYGSCRRFITQYVRSFPLPDTGHPAVAKIDRLAGEPVGRQGSQGRLEAELEELVWGSFGLPDGDRSAQR